MKKGSLNVVLFLFILAGCQRTTSDEIITVTLNKDLSEIISQLCTKGDCKECENEIFVDRISADSTRFTIRIGGYKVKRLPRPFPIMRTEINDTEFFVYTGAEEYLSVSGEFKNGIVNEPPYNCSEERWIIVEKWGNYKLIPHGGQPFNYFPDSLLPDTAYFLPPNGRVDH